MEWARVVGVIVSSFVVFSASPVLGREAPRPEPKPVPQEASGGSETEADDAAAPDGAEETPEDPKLSPDQRELRVVVAGSPPFVETDADGELAGPSVQVWKRAALDLDLNYRMESATSVDAALEQVATGRADIAVGPLSITPERAQKVAFTQPYFRSALGIASHPKKEFFQRIEPFLSAAFLTALGALLLVLSIVGVLMWSFERKKNPEQFPPKIVPGIGNGIWFALVTMTTVGYGDRAPQTIGGRVVAGGWMLIALITVSSLTAGIATALTLSQLGPTAVEKAGDLEGKRVATLTGTHSESFVRKYGGVVVGVRDLKAALEEVAEGRVDAVVFDRPALAHALSQVPDLELRLSPRRYNEQGYGFAVALDSQLDDRLDVALLEGAHENEKLFEDFKANDE